MQRLISNPPNPWASSHVEYLDEPPAAELEIFEEEAKSILSENDSPDVGFRWSVNPYRGCFHACAYCLVGDTPILMTDGTSRALSDLRPGDAIYGTKLEGRYRRFVATQVLAHWSTFKPAYRVVLADGTELVSSGDHRFLTERGWKYVAPAATGQRPYLTEHNSLLGFGRLAQPPIEDASYRQGYLCGMVRGDALLGTYDYGGRRRRSDRIHQFRLALADLEGLGRARRYLDQVGVATHEFRFAAAAGARREMFAIHTSASRHVEKIREMIEWPSEPDDAWSKGFLAGIFDAEGSCSQGILRISNQNPVIISAICKAMSRFGFNHVVESVQRERPIFNVRLRGGLRERQRFFHLVDPAITRKRTIDGVALESDADLQVVSVTALGVSLPMFDITTGTGDFIANGVVSHNCYARPSHQWLGFGAGTDFDRKIVVKTNAAALLRQALEKKSWKGERIVFSGDTDCYQPLEASYAITRACLEVCAEFKNPVGVITKSAVIRRDVDVLGRLARDARAHATVSIPFAHDDVARKIEPGASAPARRFETLRMLADAGVTTTVAIAPIIPGLNDPDIAEILERAYEAGARRAFMILLRLPGEVLPVFRERVAAELPPERVRKIEHAIQELRGGSGKMNESEFGKRFVGQGERWKAIEAMFELHRRRLGYFLDDERYDDAAPSTFQRPTRQLGLFS